MKYRLIILILLIGAVLAGIWLCHNDDQPPAPTPTVSTLPPRAAAIAQLPGRPVDFSRGAIVRVEVVFEDGTTQIVLPGVVVATATPIPTDTPNSTSTPTPTIAATWTPTNTYTPPPTNTPRPTATEAVVPSATPTSTPFYTPTVEVNTPSPTLTPTLETFPACGGTVKNSAGLNVRQDSRVDSDLIIQLQPGETVEILYVRVYEQEVHEWVRVKTLTGFVGWVAAWYYGGINLLEWDRHSELCLPPNVEYEYINDPLPVEFMPGFHSLAGEGVGVVLAPQYVGKYKLLKCLDGGFSICQQAKAANPAIKTIYRTYQHDCPPVWWEGNSEAWWNYIEGQLPPGADFYEVMNECDPPLERAGAWAQAMIEMALIVERERGASLLAFSSGPGNPDFPWWRPMWVYVDWATERNKLVGTHHGIATHSSAYAPASIDLPAGSWINNLYISGREKIVCDMAAANDYGALCGGFVWINTELGWGDGYQGNKDEFSCYEQGLMYRETIRRKTEDGIDGFALWNVGRIGSWLSVHDCMYAILG